MELWRDWSAYSIKELRLFAGLKQAEFAEKYNIKKATLSRWERGLTSPPDYLIFLLYRLMKEVDYTRERQADASRDWKSTFKTARDLRAEYAADKRDAREYGYYINENLSLEEYYSEYWYMQVGTKKGRRNLSNLIQKKWIGAGRTLGELCEELDIPREDWEKIIARESPLSLAQITKLSELLGIFNSHIEYYL